LARHIRADLATREPVMSSNLGARATSTDDESVHPTDTKRNPGGLVLYEYNASGSRGDGKCRNGSTDNGF
jgi:hypothetical protein